MRLQKNKSIPLTKFYSESSLSENEKIGISKKLLYSLKH